MFSVPLTILSLTVLNNITFVKIGLDEIESPIPNVMERAQAFVDSATDREKKEILIDLKINPALSESKLVFYRDFKSEFNQFAKASFSRDRQSNPNAVVWWFTAHSSNARVKTNCTVNHQVVTVEEGQMKGFPVYFYKVPPARIQDIVDCDSFLNPLASNVSVKIGNFEWP